MKLAAATPPWRPDLKAAAVLAVAAALATAGLFPYLLQLMPEQFAKIPLPLPLLVLAQSLQALVLLGILALLGLRMGHRLGLGAPALQRWCGADTPAQQRPAPLLAVVSGALGGGAVLLSSLVIEPWLPPMLNPPAAGLSAFNGLLASFYGGIAEELQMRLFLMTLLLWVVARVLRRRPGAAGYWLAVIVAALLFGAGHLPAAQHIWGLDGVVVMRTLVLNGVLGVLCGWLYWRRGLETAMLAHFSADLILHVLPPLLKLGAH